MAAAGAAIAALVAACGSSGTSTTGGTPGTGQQQSAAPRGVVSARSLPGIGSVLVDRSGKTVYTSEQEASGKIVCTGGCLSFWFPVTVAPGTTPHGGSGVTGTLGTIRRSGDGMAQLTYDGQPLYTFKLDKAPGQAHGNNFTDSFGSTTFTWHAVTTSGGQAGSDQGSSGYSGY